MDVPCRCYLNSFCFCITIIYNINKVPVLYNYGVKISCVNVKWFKFSALLMFQRILHVPHYRSCSAASFMFHSNVHVLPHFSCSPHLSCSDASFMFHHILHFLQHPSCSVTSFMFCCILHVPQHPSCSIESFRF